MEPWLEGLSEEWDSEPQLSPPHATIVKKNNSNSTSQRVSSNISQSRIPHLAHNIRHGSNSSFLKPRSSRGIARMKENNALVERTASSLNAMPLSPTNLSKRRLSSNVPLSRRASSVLSDSQTSVQHHTIDKTNITQDTPEWKRRLKETNELTSDGFDLFSPSKLEGIFKQSSCPVEPEDEENDPSIVFTDKKPWNSLSDAMFPPPSENHTTYRSSKSRPATMDTLQEAEEEDDHDKIYGLSAISSDIVREGSIKGIVSRRVSNLELAQRTEFSQGGPRNSQDPRMRTISGRKEISDEVLSPLEDSEKSSIRKQALQETLDADPPEFRKRLREVTRQSSHRSRSRSSDHDISYDAEGLNDPNQSILPEDPMAEMTSQSLPEDLSMGTQNYMSNSILIHPTRQFSGAGGSVVVKRQKPSGNSSLLDGIRDFRSSPPPYKHEAIEESRLSLSEPPSPGDGSIIHHDPTSVQQSSAGSPLKLFGNRDTYTNNKLMRVLSQFEDERSESEPGSENGGFRMSNFGRGELDGFGFNKEVERPAVENSQLGEGDAKVFRDLMLLTVQENDNADAAIQPTPSKERSPKRRRTLLKDELFVNGTEVEVKISHMSESSLAGKKRRDALPGKIAEQASPETLASRPIIRPSGSRRSSGNAHSRTVSATEALQQATNTVPLQEQLAAELESFVHNVVEVKQDSRKASLATKDYMEEANKVMEFIRARGKPKPALSGLPESGDVSELNADAILDLEIEEDSTKDSFSRPPSREGRALPKMDRRHAQHDAQTADHLQKFRDLDDLELLTSTSALGNLQLVDNQAVEEAALVPVPEDQVDDEPELEESFQSEPRGMRILNENDRKRKHSESQHDAQETHGSQNTSSDGSKRTIMTNSSSSSGHRGMITQGTVSIPDTIGVMTFDRERKAWIKQHIKIKKSLAPCTSPESKAGRQDVSEADPFDGIPDLSFDETKEASWKKSPKHGQNQRRPALCDEDAGNLQVEDNLIQSGNVNVVVPPKSSLKSPRRQRVSEDLVRLNSKQQEASKHEERLHNGIASQEIDMSKQQQPRVVTIAFSSPIASEIPYVLPPSTSNSDLDEDDPSLLPLDDEGSVLASSPVKHTDETEIATVDTESMRSRTMLGSLERHEQYRAMTLNRRPVSRIDEYDEEQAENQEMSLIHIRHGELTPLPEKDMTLVKPSTKRESSILCLTPLSEFTLHQVDRLNHPEESFVAERANPKSLRQAHGSHALVEDALVKAITDAEPTELFWEQLRRLCLQNSDLASLHGLKDYCSSLDVLDVANNKISQLTDLPLSVRSLYISSNLVNDLTSWTHLHNLQTIDVSSNHIENLECFSGLIHLRHLKASNNRIRSIEGILDLTGLINLDLSSNDIPEVDFQGCELGSLEELNLSKNNLMHARNLNYLPKVKHIDLTENLLEDLTIKQEHMVENLETLYLAQNELRDLDLTAFPSLQRLNIDKNLIATLYGLVEAEHLSILSACDQRVSSNLINDVLTSPHDLNELYLSSNAFPQNGVLSLPAQPNFSLRHLELASCGIQSLPDGFGDTFPNIRVLNLNFNALSDLSHLQGSIKLRQLLIAKNRVKRMRRTCLTISRLPTLKKVDLRDNPLTVGFYAPLDNAHDNCGPGTERSGPRVQDQPYRLPAQRPEQDKKWVGLMDEMTWLRRRAMELLLAECCAKVEEVDGLPFHRDIVMKERAGWEKLMGKGVLKKEEKGEGKESSVAITGRREVTSEKQ